MKEERAERERQVKREQDGAKTTALRQIKEAKKLNAEKEREMLELDKEKSAHSTQVFAFASHFNFFGDGKVTSKILI